MWALAVVAVATVVTLARWRRSGRRLVDFLGLGVVMLYARLWHRCTSNGPAPLPPAGPALLVSNHTCSADPAFLAWCTPRLLGFLVTRSHYNLHPLVRRLMDHIGCTPVVRNGRDVAAAR